MSDADSEDFGRFLDDSASNAGGNRTRRVDLDVEARRIVRGRRERPPRTAISLDRPRDEPPLRIRTRRPINLRLRPPPEPSESAVPDRADPQLRVDAQLQRPPLARDGSGQYPPGFRVLSRSEVRNISIAKPPSSASIDESTSRPNATMQWRLRGLLGDSASLTSFQTRHDADAESDRFSLGTIHPGIRPASRPPVDEGTLTGIRRALDSRAGDREPKRARPNARMEKILEHLDSSEPILNQDVPDSRDGLVLKSDGNSMDVQDLEPHSGPDSEPAREFAPEFGREPAHEPAPEPGLARENAESEQEPVGSGENLFVDGPPSQLSSDEAPRREPSEANEDDGRPRPREPLEIEAPLVFDVPVSEIPNINWGAEDLDVDGKFLKQQLEHSESESEEESDAGSVAEMIDDDSDDEQFLAEPAVQNAEWVDPNEQDTAFSSDDSDSDVNRVEALTDSDTDNEKDYVDPEVDLTAVETVAEARRQRPKRARIPTVNWWLGECIEYETDAKHQVMTAVDVRRVEPPQKVYRRRRAYRRRRPTGLPLSMDDMQAEASQETIQVPVFDTARREWRDRTVAKSISGLEFGPVEAEDGSRLPLVTQCILFGGKHDSSPLRLLVLRIEPGGMYSYGAEQNKASTFVVWRGKCTVHLNNHEFDISKGMACLVPRGNDLFVDNGSAESLSTGDVYLFVTEVNAEKNPELADALTRDAQSMISGAAAFSHMLEQTSDLTSEQSNDGPGNVPGNVPANVPPSRSPPPESFDDNGDVGGDFGGDVGGDFGGDFGGGGESFAEAGSDNAGNDRESVQTDLFGRSFSRALGKSESGGVPEPAPRVLAERRPLRPVQEAPGDSFDSLSLALAGDSGILRDRRPDPPLRRREEEEEDSLDMFSDYLEGRRKGRQRLVLHDRPVGDLAEFRIARYLHRAHSDGSSR